MQGGMGKSTRNRKEEIARLRGDTFRTRAILVLVSSIISVSVASLVLKSTQVTDENASALLAANPAAQTSQVELTDSSHVTDARKLAEEISLEALCAMTDEQLAGQDIAYLNLKCAEDLPGFHSGIAEFLTKLDFMADWVGKETSKNLHRYYQAPGNFGHSVARFKAGMMVTILAQDFKCGYNRQGGLIRRTPNLQGNFTPTRRIFSSTDFCVRRRHTALARPSLSFSPPWGAAWATPSGWPARKATCSAAGKTKPTASTSKEPTGE